MFVCYRELLSDYFSGSQNPAEDAANFRSAAKMLLALPMDVLAAINMIELSD